MYKHFIDRCLQRIQIHGLCALMRQSAPSGRQLSSLRMKRVDELAGPQMLAGFTRMDTDLMTTIL